MKTFELYNLLCPSDRPFRSEQDWTDNATRKHHEQLIDACRAKIASAPCSPEATHLACLDALVTYARKGASVA